MKGIAITPQTVRNQPMKTRMTIRPRQTATCSPHTDAVGDLGADRTNKILMGFVLAAFLLSPHRTLAAAPTVDNADGASNVLSTSAILTGTLTSTGGLSTRVFVYWGETDGDTIFADWGHTNDLGIDAVGPLSLEVTNLGPNRVYYYRFYATNLSGGAWAGATANFRALVAPVDLKSAAHFTILAGASITSTGSGIVNGDVGLSPGTSQGIPPAQINGAVHVGDPIAVQAQADLAEAYADVADRSEGRIAVAGNIGGQTLAPGLYRSSSSLQITGDLVLDGGGNSNAVWIFQIGSTLDTAAGVGASKVVLTNGAQVRNIFWQVGSSATLGTYSVFNGTILAAVSITMDTGSIVDGRVLAQAGTVAFSGALRASLPMPEAPRFTRISRPTGDSVVVVLNTTPYFLLTLEATPDLVLTNWTTITSGTPATNPCTLIDDTATATMSQRFYRAFITGY